MPKLYLVRHAEPGTVGVLLGQTDPSLSEAGRERAKAISLPDVAMIYTSELRRARETAAEFAHTAIVAMAELNEISYGDWDGCPWAEIERDYPEMVAAKRSDWLGVTPPGGECWAEFERRIVRALDRILEGPFPAAVVAHFAVNAQIASILKRCDPLQFSQDYCEIHEYGF
jgi:alpha-ribazole phosphatase